MSTKWSEYMEPMSSLRNTCQDSIRYLYFKINMVHEHVLGKSLAKSWDS